MAYCCKLPPVPNMTAVEETFHADFCHKVVNKACPHPDCTLVCPTRLDLMRHRVMVHNEVEVNLVAFPDTPIPDSPQPRNGKKKENMRDQVFRSLKMPIYRCGEKSMTGSGKCTFTWSDHKALPDSHITAHAEQQGKGKKKGFKVKIEKNEDELAKWHYPKGRAN